MLASHRAITPSNISIQPTKITFSNNPRNINCPSFVSYNLDSNRREFSWGVRHKWSIFHKCKDFKSLDTQGRFGKMLNKEYLSRAASWDHQSLLRRYTLIHGRLAGSWGQKKPGAACQETDQSANTQRKAEQTTTQDWYQTYTNRKKNEYEEFMKRAEDDPYTTLFGTSAKWLRWTDSTVPRSTGPHSFYFPTGSESTKQSKESRDLKERPIESNKQPYMTSQCQKTRNDQSAQKSAIVGGQYQEYDIDPITMRKIPRTPINPATIPYEPAKDPSESYNIPIKPFNKSSTAPAAGRPPEDAGFAGSNFFNVPAYPVSEARSWLVDEGFSNCRNPTAESKSEDATHKPAAPKIESALDRHLQAKFMNDKPTHRPWTQPQSFIGTLERILDKMTDSRQSFSEDTSADCSTKHNKPSSEKANLQYTPHETRSDDVDLLRANDVRASAGVLDRTEKDSIVAKQARLQKLEEQFAHRSVDPEKRLAQEVASKQSDEKSCDSDQDKNALKDKIGISVMDEVSDSKLSLSTTPIVPNTDLHWAAELQQATPERNPILKKRCERMAELSPLSQLRIDHLEKVISRIVPLKPRIDPLQSEDIILKKRWLDERDRQETADKTTELHEQEVKTQKAAMEAIEVRDTNNTSGVKPSTLQDICMERGEGDLASNVHEFANTGRWYKRKAPHAKCEMEAKMQQLVSDNALIQEIKGIYEDDYGKINTHHRQHKVAEDQSSPTTTAQGPLPAKSDVPSLEAGPEQASSSYNEDQPLYLDEIQSTDVLVNIQTIFDRVRAAQTFLQDQRDGSKQNCEGLAGRFDKLQHTKALARVQNICHSLRKAQSIIQEHRAQLRQPTHTEDQNDISKLANLTVYEHSMMQVATGSWKLARMCSGMLPDDPIAQGLMDAVVAAISTPTISNRPLLTSTARPIAPKSAGPKPHVYRILAYDLSTQRVNTAKLNLMTPLAKDRLLSPLKALESINSPGKFMGPLQNLNNQGYDIIGGGSNMLILEKARDPHASEETSAVYADDYSNRPNPVDGTTSAVGNFASPTDFVNHDPVVPRNNIEVKEPFSLAADRDRSADKVRREEEVFSGPSRGSWQESNANGKRFSKKHKRATRRRKTFKSMILIGVWTAACCYTVGVASEYMLG